MTNQSTENRIVPSSKSNVYFIDQKKTCFIFVFWWFSAEFWTFFSPLLLLWLFLFSALLNIDLFFVSLGLLTKSCASFRRSFDLCLYMLWFMSGHQCIVLRSPIENKIVDEFCSFAVSNRIKPNQTKLNQINPFAHTKDHENMNHTAHEPSVNSPNTSNQSSIF